MSKKLYVSNALPLHWIGELDGALWVFPAQDNGWEARTEYKGHRAALQETPVYNAYGTGYYAATDKLVS